MILRSSHLAGTKVQTSSFRNVLMKLRNNTSQVLKILTRKRRCKI